MNSKKRKIFSSVVATTLAAAILLTGTFAWQSISQTAKNEVQGLANPGGRLHDDFNGKNKDVYVENFTDPTQNGVPIFARIKLHEYMEVGAGAGTDQATDVKKIGKKDAERDDPTTWTTHMHGYFPEDDSQGNPDGDIHDYWSLTMGGKTVYMPTFNKNKDSKKADINGTFAGTDNNPTTNDDRYKDYKKYEIDEQKSDKAVYDNDKNDVEEESPQEGVDIVTKQETHKAKETKEATIMTMDEWKFKGEPIGDYWVYDKDGWAYWASPIMPGETTGLLLDEITMDKEPDDEFYYAINVTGQFATAGDWGDKAQGTGFYKDKITDDAVHFLDKVADRLPKIRKMAIKGGSKQYVKAGQSLTLTTNIDIKNATGIDAEKYVTWTIDPKTTALKGNVFSPSEKMAGKTYRITATSGIDKTKTASVDVFVLPSTSSGTVNGQLDGKKYIDYGDNTYKEILDDGTLGEFVCGGKDGKVGTNDDINTVVVLEHPDVKFGSKFIGPEDGGLYMSVGPDGKLGTADDVKVAGSPWPQNITDKLADEIIITTNENKETVKVDKALQFNAQVKLKGNPIELQDVTWSVSGSNGSSSIAQNGVLTVGANEKHEARLTVTATSKLVPTLKTHKTVTVKPWDLDDIPSLDPGSKTTITVDGVQFYMLAKNGREALLWAKDAVGEAKQFSQTAEKANWRDSDIRTYLNSEWLNSTKVLKEKVVQKDITTRIENKEEWYTTQDKVFLLTEADITGKRDWSTVNTSDARDYTYGSTPFASGFTYTGKSNYAWLRSTAYYSSSYANNLSTVGVSGNTAGALYNSTLDIRPAMWVKFGEDPSPQGPSKKK